MVKDLGIPISDDFFYETYNVPKPGNYNDIKNQNQQPKTNTEKHPQQKEQPEEPQKEQEKKNLNLFERIKSFFQPAPVSTGAIQTSTPCCNHISLALPKHHFSDELLIKRVWEQKGRMSFDHQLFQFFVKLLAKGFKKGWDKKYSSEVKLADLGFTYGTDDPAMLTAFELNLFRFAGAKNISPSTRNSTKFSRNPNLLMNSTVKPKPLQ